jgi:hypothetical protein
MRQKTIKIPINLIANILFTIGIVLCNYWARQNDFVTVFCAYTFAFFGLLLLWKYSLNVKKNYPLWIFFLSSIAIVHFPNLSDDWYRFIWDGNISKLGQNVFTTLPSQFIDQHFNQEVSLLYEGMNSKNYYTVYPLILQVLFYLSASIGQTVFQKVVVLKLLYLSIHFIGYSFLSKHKNINSKSLMLYYLNPLVITEGIGNLHAEIAMVSFMAIAYYMLTKSHFLCALFFSLAVATKILPLLLVPLLYFALDKKSFYKLSYLSLTFILVLMLPVLMSSTEFGSSLDLYFQKFEFNASLYYIFRYIGEVITGYNQIALVGPSLGIIALIGIIWFSKSEEKSIDQVFAKGAIVFAIYFLCSTIVHPWYVITVVFFSSISQYRSLLMWSYTSTWSYLYYHHGAFKENYLVLTLEYSIVIVLLIYEFYKPNKVVKNRD